MRINCDEIFEKPVGLRSWVDKVKSFLFKKRYGNAVFQPVASPNSLSPHHNRLRMRILVRVI